MATVKVPVVGGALGVALSGASDGDLGGVGGILLSEDCNLLVSASFERVGSTSAEEWACAFRTPLLSGASIGVMGGVSSEIGASLSGEGFLARAEFSIFRVGRAALSECPGSRERSGKGSESSGCGIDSSGLGNSVGERAYAIFRRLF